MKGRNQNLTPSLRSHRLWRLAIVLVLLGGLALACDFSQFLTAAPPSPAVTEAPITAEVTAENPSPTAEPAFTLAAEDLAQHRQYLPLLSGGETTAQAKGVTPAPTSKLTRTTNGSPATPTVTPTVYATITPIPLSYLCIPPQTPQLGLVTKVIDGDTIRVLLDGKEEKVRYIGIDTPESTRTQEEFGKEATKRNAQLVRGQIVELYRDVSQTDRYGRLLRYVVTNSVFVNLKLIEEGYAVAVTYPPDVACAVIFQQAERTARLLGKGLWGLPITPTP